MSFFVLELFLHCILYDLSDSTVISMVSGLEDKVELPASSGIFIYIRVYVHL